MSEADVPRRCRKVQAWLPDLVDGRLPGWKRRLAERHLDRCERCAAELERQRVVEEGLSGLERRSGGAEHEAPDELLESILERSRDTGLRGRVAVPARGAVSGARPELSAAAVLALLAILYLAWRTVRALVELLDEE